MMKRTAAAVCGAAVLAAGMTGCGAGFEGSGSKDAASAEQLAMRLDDPWAQEVQADQGAKAEGELADGVYTGTGKGMEGLVTVKLLVQDNRISCLETGKYYEQGSMSLQIGGETWVLVDTFAKSKPTDKHFI